MPPRLRKHASGHLKHVTNENLNVDTSDSDSSNDESGDDVNLNDTNVENMEAGNINYDDVDDVDVGANENDHDDQVGDHDANINVVHVDIFDPKNWDNLTSDMIKVLVAEGPKRDKS
ncbi:hypothetical protein Tco_0229405, partial [Tanacetum coccineum]